MVKQAYKACPHWRWRCTDGHGWRWKQCPVTDCPGEKVADY